MVEGEGRDTQASCNTASKDREGASLGTASIQSISPSHESEAGKPVRVLIP